MADSWDCDTSETHNGPLFFNNECPNDPRKFEKDVFCEFADEGFIDQQATQSRSPNRKRKQPDSRDSTEARESKLRLLLLSEGNPVSQLHESGLKISFEFLGSQGPAHQPSFTFSAVVDDVPYNAVGSTKKQAKENAARRAVETLRERLGLRGTQEKESATSTAVFENSSVENSFEQPTCSVEKAALVPVDESIEDVDNLRILNSFRSPPVATSTATLMELSEAFSVFPTNGWSKLLELMRSAASTTDACALAERIATCLKVSSQISECSHSFPLPEIFNRKPKGHFAFMFKFASDTFYAVSHQKKSAKHSVGSQVLNWFLDIAPIFWRNTHILQSLAAPFSDLTDDALRAHRFASEVCIKVYEKLNEIAACHAGSNLIRHIDHNHLAAVCVCENGIVTPVVFATGSSVIYRKNLSSRGRNLKDCQAEILALRGVKRYLLGQVAAFIAGKDTIFQNFSKEGKLRLKEDVGFHLFLTHSPSGSCSFQKPIQTKDSASSTAAPSVLEKFHYLDSEIASVLTLNSTSASTSTSTSASTSAIFCHVSEKTENCFYEITEGHEKLKIMSSSDKLMKKLVVGIQGSLVSAFAHPVFLQTICMRGNDKLERLASGLYGRLLPEISRNLEKMEEFPLVCPEIPNDLEKMEEFPLVCPEICGTFVMDGLDEKTLKQNPGLKAFLWIRGDTEISDTEEFIDTSTGLTVSGKSSNVSKKNFGIFFRNLSSIENCNQISWPGLTESMQKFSTFADLKNFAISYRKKVKFFQEISRKLGSWISKCPEEEKFSVLEVSSSNVKE